MPDQIGITVVGAGVVGCALARELATAGEEVLVLERNPGVTQGENQSSRNSGVIHAGLYYDREICPLKAALCAQGNELLYQFCRQYGVPAIKTGKLVVASNAEHIPVLDLYLERARQNSVSARLLKARKVWEREPQVKAVAALLLPTSGIIDPTALIYKLYALAAGQGAEFLTQTEVIAVDPAPAGLKVSIRYRDGARDTFLTNKLVNCAGLYSDEVARMVDPSSPYVVDPVRGEAMKFYRTKRKDLELVGMNIYPTPRKITTERGTYFTVGVHLTPTLQSDARGEISLGPVVTVGPLNRQAWHKEDYGEPFQQVSQFHQQVSAFFPGIGEDDLEPHQTGIQARLAGHQDWVIEFSPRHPHCLNLLGIDSPGLTACLAIARHVRTLILR